MEVIIDPSELHENKKVEINLDYLQQMEVIEGRTRGFMQRAESAVVNAAAKENSAAEYANFASISAEMAMAESSNVVEMRDQIKTYKDETNTLRNETQAFHDDAMTFRDTASGFAANAATKADEAKNYALNAAASANSIRDLEPYIDRVAMRTTALETATNDMESRITNNTRNIANKQDKLTAGTNINIVDNVISAKGGGEVPPELINQVSKNTEDIAGLEQNSTSLSEEITTLKSGKIDDVTINGTSIKNGTVAEIPTSANGVFGVVKLNTKEGISYNTSGIMLQAVSADQISRRYTHNSSVGYGAITTQNYDSAVRYALTDGKGQAYTDEEKAKARERIGALSNEWELIVDATVEEAGLEYLTLDLPSNFALYKDLIFCFFNVNGVGANNYIRFLDSNNSYPAITNDVIFYYSSVMTRACIYVSSIENIYLSKGLETSTSYSNGVSKLSIANIINKNSIAKIRIYKNGTNSDIGNGTSIKIWGEK